MKEFLFYVRKYCLVTNDYKLYVYKCKTHDPFHTMGEMLFRSLEHIERITFVEYEEFREKYWLDIGFEILEWKDKYLN